MVGGALQDKAVKTFWPQRVSLYVKEPEGRGSPTSATLESLDSSDGRWARGWKVFNLVFWKHFFFFFIFFILFFLYCSGFCHTLKWNSHGFTCVPHPDPPSHFLIEPLLLSAFTASGWVQSVVRELTSCKLHGLAKKNKKAMKWITEGKEASQLLKCFHHYQSSNWCSIEQESMWSMQNNNSTQIPNQYLQHTTRVYRMIKTQYFFFIKFEV